MADVLDVAQYILAKSGKMSAMKLQKLVYYAQAWHLVWTDDVLFPNKIEAWRDGPVCPDLFQLHAKAFRVSKLRRGDAARLTDDEKDTVDRILSFYGSKSPQWLSDLSQLEDPWRDARDGALHDGRNDAEITPASVQRYYASL